MVEVAVVVVDVAVVVIVVEIEWIGCRNGSRSGAD